MGPGALLAVLLLLPPLDGIAADAATVAPSAARASAACNAPTSALGKNNGCAVNPASIVSENTATSTLILGNMGIRYSFQ